MNKKLKFIVLTILLVAGRCFDVYSTSVYTPDLSHETNIVVQYLGAGWTTMIILQLLLTGLVTLSLYYYIFKFKTVRYHSSGLTFKQYVSYCLFNDVNSFSKAFYKMPDNKSVLIASGGYIATMTLITISYIVGTSTTFLILSEDYRNLYRMGIPVLLYCVIGLSVFYFTMRFFRLEYGKYTVDHARSSL